MSHHVEAVSFSSLPGVDKLTLEELAELSTFLCDGIDDLKRHHRYDISWSVDAGLEALEDEVWALYCARTGIRNVHVIFVLPAAA